MKPRNLAIVVAFTFACVAGADPESASVVYTHGQELYFATASGKVIRMAHVTFPVDSFAVSPDAATVILSSRESEYGGHLYILNVPSGVSKRLRLAGNYFAKGEVYSDPDISPDGKRVAFAIHGAPKGDLVEASGPFAILDLRTEKVNLLRSTMHIDDKNFEFVAFANEP